MCSPPLQGERASSTAATRRSEATCTRASRRRRALHCCTVRRRRAAHNASKVVKLRAGGAWVRGRVLPLYGIVFLPSGAVLRGITLRRSSTLLVPLPWCCARPQNHGILAYLASSPRQVRREPPCQRSDLSLAGDGRASRCVGQDRLQVRGGDAIAVRCMKPSEISRSGRDCTRLQRLQGARRPEMHVVRA